MSCILFFEIRVVHFKLSLLLCNGLKFHKELKHVHITIDTDLFKCPLGHPKTHYN